MEGRAESGGAGIQAGRGVGSREEREAGGTTVRARDPGPRLRAALVAAAGCQGTGDLGPAGAFRHPVLPDAQRADRPAGSDGRGSGPGQAASPPARAPRADPLGAGPAARGGRRRVTHPPPRGLAAASADPESADPGDAGPAGPPPDGAGLAAGIAGDVTPEGAAALAAIAADPGRALIALDFDGTLAPIVSEPSAARPHPGVLPALRQLAASVGTLAIITGRPATVAVELGGFGGIPGLIVIGHHGWERWEGGELTSPPPPPEVAQARAPLPGAPAAAGAPGGRWVEDKSPALVVHPRRAADPEAALALLAGPLADFASQTGLDSKPGRLVIELRPRGVDKGTAITALAAER